MGKWVAFDRTVWDTSNVGMKYRPALASSLNPGPHEVEGRLFGRAPQDPWISISNYMVERAVQYDQIVYGGNGYGAPLAAKFAHNVLNHKGANVYVRANSNNPTSVAPRLETCENREGVRECMEGPSIVKATRIGKVDATGRTCRWINFKLAPEDRYCLGMKCSDITNRIGRQWHNCHKKARRHRIENGVKVGNTEWGCMFNADTEQCEPELPSDVPCDSYNLKRKNAWRKKMCKKIGTLARGCAWDNSNKMCVEGA